MANEALSEKVSVNINPATISSIDLLIDNGYYSNRSDFINQALREALQRQQSTIDRLITGNTESQSFTSQGKSDQFFLGVRAVSPKEVSDLYNRGAHISIRGYGSLILDQECEEEKLFAVLESITLKGKLYASPSVKEHYGFH